MPKKGKRTDVSPGIRTGRAQDDQFHHLISPLGEDAAQEPTYSPSREVGEDQPKSRASQSESARAARRGE